MNIQKLQDQAFRLYVRLRAERFNPRTFSVRRERLDSLMLIAYARYERRRDLQLDCFISVRDSDALVFESSKNSFFDGAAATTRDRGDAAAKSESVGSVCNTHTKQWNPTVNTVQNS